MYYLEVWRKKEPQEAQKELGVFATACLHFTRKEAHAQRWGDCPGIAASKWQDPGKNPGLPDLKAPAAIPHSLWSENSS